VQPYFYTSKGFRWSYVKLVMCSVNPNKGMQAMAELSAVEGAKTKVLERQFFDNERLLQDIIEEFSVVTVGSWTNRGGSESCDKRESV
jgi:hypothetical protein